MLDVCVPHVVVQDGLIQYLLIFCSLKNETRGDGVMSLTCWSQLLPGQPGMIVLQLQS